MSFQEEYGKLICDAKIAIQEGWINTQPRQGSNYHILHEALFLFRDVWDNEKNEEMALKLLLDLLKDESVDPNVLHYKGGSLAHLIAELSADKALKLFEVIEEAQVAIDYNLPNCNGNLPAHLWLNRLPEYLDPEYSEDQKYFQKRLKIFNFLLSKTIITETVSQRFQEQFDYAITSQRNICIIETLMERELVTFDPSQYLPDERFMVPEFLSEGCWLRTIPNAEIEIQNLIKRRGKSLVELQGHTEKGGEDYTKYSPATFNRGSAPVNTFGFSDYGIIISQRKGRNIIHWYDGLKGECLTRDLCFEGELVTESEGKYFEGHSFKNVSEPEIAEALLRAYQTHERITEMARRRDRFGVFESVPYVEPLSWNEGLFRYQEEDIVGIYFIGSNLEKAVKLNRQLSIGLGKDQLFSTYEFHTDWTALREVPPDEFIEFLENSRLTDYSVSEMPILFSTQPPVGEVVDDNPSVGFDGLNLSRRN